MKRLEIDYDEVQKAAEDIERLAFDYYLDLRTGDVVVLSREILDKADQLLSDIYEDDLTEFDEIELEAGQETDIPDWMEDEVELALEIFLDNDNHYARIPERDPGACFRAMREFAERSEDTELGRTLFSILDGKNAFRRFKDALAPYPGERKSWYRFNSKYSRREIEEWLAGLGIEGQKSGSAEDQP